MSRSNFFAFRMPGGNIIATHEHKGHFKEW